MGLFECIFWIGFAIVFYSYIGYGILLYFLVKLKNLFSSPKQYDLNYEPTVSLVVPCFNEADYIVEKIKNSLLLEYPKDKLQLITFIKKFTSNGQEQNAFVLPIKLINDYYNAPLYIYNTTNQIISPYRRYNGSLGDDYILLESYGSYTSSTDTNAFRSSLLYQGIMSNTNISGLQTKTIIQDLTDKNEKFRKIKILNKQFLVPFIETFNNMISNDDIRFRVISKEN